MPEERIFSDFSGGMNALAAVDKLDPKECLLAENVRLDETGNVQSAGAFTHQNTAAYAAASGSNTNNVHSLYWNPSLGAVAGVGKDVFAGATLGGMVNTLTGSNMGQQKMSFGSAYNRVYFDVGNTGYWTDLSNLLTVDWPPPVAVGATVTGPTTVGTGVLQAGTGASWTNPNNVTSINSNTVAVATWTGGLSNPTRPITATMTTNSFAISTVAVTGISISIILAGSKLGIGLQGSLIVGGIPIGSQKAFTPLIPPVAGIFNTYTAGGSTDLWGLSSLSQAQINAGNFGFQFVGFFNGVNPITLSAYQLQITVYQGTGFTAGTSTVAFGGISGTYSYKITFVDNQGEESDASNESNAVVLTGTAGTITGIQLGDGRTTARNIYRKGGTLTSHYLVGTLQDNNATTFLDNVNTDIQALANGVILAGDVPGDYANTRFNLALSGAINAPSGLGRFPTLHYDRIFWINPNKTNQLFWSKPLNGFAYPSVNFINVGDSKPITRHVSIFGELIIIKTDGIWRLTGTDETSFDLTPTPSAVGTDEPFTVVALPDKILFANRWGKWVFNGYTSQPFTTKLDLWFKQEDRTGTSLFGVNGFHPPEVASTTVPLVFESVGNSEKEYFAYAEAGQAANNAVVVSDLKHGNITKRQLGTPLPLSLAIDPVTGFVYVGDNQGFVSLLDDWNGASQGGSTANFDFQTSYFDLQRGSNKSLWALEFFINTNGESLTPTVYYDNGVNSEALPAISASGLQRIVRTMESTNSRKMQNFSVRLNGSLNPINVSGTPQVQLVHIKALFDIRTGRARTGQ